MDIEFRSVSGSRVGFIIGNDIKDSNGNRVGMIVGNDIKDTYGNRVGILNGSDIKDISGNRVGMIIGNDIKDTYGNRVGYPIGSASQIEMAAAGLLLLNLKYEVTASTPSSSNSKENSGNYSKYENNAASGGSFENDLIKIDDQYYPNQLYQATQGLISKAFSTNYAEADRRKKQLDLEEEIERSNREYQEKQNQILREYYQEKELKEKEAWKKKRKYVYGLGGLIGGLVFTILPMLDIGLTSLILIGLTIASIIVFSKLWSLWWVGLIGGVVMFFAVISIYELYEILPFRAVAFPIGFIFGTLIILIIRKILY